LKITQKFTDNITNQFGGKTLARLPLLLGFVTLLSLGLYFVDSLQHVASIILDISLFGWADLVAIVLTRRGWNVYISVLLSAIFLVLVGVLVYFALGLLTGN